MTNMKRLGKNQSSAQILMGMLVAAASLFVNGFGVYLTIHAGIGAGPWDVFNLGLSHTFGMLYGTASITVSIVILAIDVILREPIGVAMIIDALVVGKSVDFFNYVNVVPVPETLWGAIVMIFVGLAVIGYTQFLYMATSLGCGPRDTLMVGVKRRLKRIPIGAVSILILALATLTGYLLGGPVGIGTILCAFASGPIMQFAFQTVRFDATAIRHQSITQSILIFMKKESSKHDA